MTSPGRAAGVSGPDDLAAWAIPSIGLLVLVSGAAVWVAGGLVSLLAGHGWVAAPFALSTAVEVARHGTRRTWPGADPRLIVGVAVGLCAVVLVPIATAVVRVRRHVGGGTQGLAGAVHLGSLTAAGARRRAAQLRPSLAAGHSTGLADVGVLLGHLRPGRRVPVLSSWEDVGLALMAPRSGKTSALAVPTTLAAPGAVVLTSNKTEGWKETAALRAADTGQRVWTFDPQRIAHEPQTWWWNPLRGMTTVADASRLASHFITTVRGERSDAAGEIWNAAAGELLATLILAAALDGRPLVDVYDWLAEESTPVPRGILAERGHDLLARTLRSTQDAPPETRGSVYFTARAAAACLRDASITAWITPPSDASMAEFVAEGFPTSRQTLYLLSKEEGGSAGPLVAALTDRIMRAGVVGAERAGGRLDPPMVLVLDEAANICRIADLPALYSHLGSRGICPWTILQSYSQAVGVWGSTGARALWGAATVKLIGAGMDDADFAEDVSRLVGDHEVRVASRSSGGRGGSSWTHSSRPERVLSAAQVRQLPKGSALLLATGCRPALLRLAPWFAGPRRVEITAAVERAEQRVRQHAASSS